MARVGLVSDSLFLEHDSGFGHPERPDRLTAIAARLEQTGTRRLLQVLEPRDCDRLSIERVHTAGHFDLIESLSKNELAAALTGDTGISPATFAAAIRASGGVLEAIDAVLEGRVVRAFCCHRPPGHHAEREQAMGFCYFNHVAVAARYLQCRHDIQRIAIIDWDVHHGNGTQHTFDGDADVFFFSIHQYPHYPGTGAAQEAGIGKGLGATLNVPVAAGTGDAQYISVFSDVLRPAMDAFGPDFMLVSAGFDAHASDPLGGVMLSAAGFERMTQLLLAMAEEHCGGKIVSLLEGGYDLQATAASVDAHVRVLCG